MPVYGCIQQIGISYWYVRRNHLCAHTNGHGQLSSAQRRTDPTGVGVSEHHQFYYGNCCGGPIYQNVYRITTNCAVLGVALQNAAKDLNFAQASLYGFGAGAGFSLVLILFSAMRERLATADIPQPFQGAAIAMITAGLMSLAFMGFGGLV